MLIGQPVYIEYLDINEIEATCWLCDYSFLAYLDNSNLTLKLSDIGKRTTAKIKDIDKDTGRIELTL